MSEPRHCYSHDTLYDGDPDPRPKAVQVYDLKLLIKYLESIEDEAYEGFHKYLETDFETAQKFREIIEWAENLMDSELAMQTICTILGIKKPSRDAWDSESLNRGKLRFRTWLAINKIYPYGRSIYATEIP